MYLTFYFSTKRSTFQSPYPADNRRACCHPGRGEWSGSRGPPPGRIQAGWSCNQLGQSQDFLELCEIATFEVFWKSFPFLSD